MSDLRGNWMTANGAAAVLVNGETVDCLSSLDRGLLRSGLLLISLHLRLDLLLGRVDHGGDLLGGFGEDLVGQGL